MSGGFIASPLSSVNKKTDEPYEEINGSIGLFCHQRNFLLPDAPVHLQPNQYNWNEANEALKMLVRCLFSSRHIRRRTS